MDNISAQSCWANRLDRFLHRCDDSIASPLCLHCLVKQPSSHCPFQCHRTSHRRLGGAANCRSVSGEQCTTASRARSRRNLRSLLHRPSCRYGHRTSSDIPRSPWQICYVERVIGIRRECLNHMIVINDWHLRRILKSYFRYYHRSRTHLSLEKDAPESRPVQKREPGRIIQISEFGGLHHRYERLVA